MEMLLVVCGYMAVAMFGYYVTYAIAVDSNYRLPLPSATGGQRLSFLQEQKEILKLLRLDFFRIHCPWSRKISIHYRVLEARRLLQHSVHEKGWTVEHCDDSLCHAQIAQDCFVPRSLFWSKELLTILTYPILLLVVVLVLIVVCVVSAVTELR